MTPGARIAASIELVEAILPTLEQRQATPVDVLMQRYFKARRYIGAKDRGQVAQLVYYVLRRLSSLIWQLQEVGTEINARHIVLVAQQEAGGLETDYWKEDRYAPKAPDATEQGWLRAIAAGRLKKKEPDYARNNAPEWLMPELAQRFGEDTPRALAALNEEAPVDLRANTLKTTREELIQALAQEGFVAEPLALSPWGVRLMKRGPLFNTKAFRAGLFEMQDEGSQLIALVGGAKPGERVIDFCAGAGGKTLALAAQMRNKGRILALDIAAHRMADLKKRLVRAGVDNAEAHVIASESDPWLKRHKATADLVLVDAPCSGSGTWRRNPDLKWRLTPETLADLQETQANILDSAARLVKPGGRLVYATCSVLQSENEQQVSRLLANRNDFRVVPIGEIWDNPAAAREGDFLRLSPHQDGTDGFFAARLARNPAD